MGVLADLKNVVKNVVPHESSANLVYGAANEYVDIDGKQVAVGFTNNSVYVIRYNGELADMPIWKKIIDSWIKEDDLKLNDILDFEEVEVIASIDADNELAFNDSSDIFEENILEDINERANKVFSILGFEREVSLEEIMGG